MLNNIRIVLINTSHPGNIGSAARAMKTMGITQLDLVQPISYPHPKAKELAVHAQDVLDTATIHDDLNTAIADAELVVGTSTRSRTIPWPILTPRQFAEKVAQEPRKISILFGREQSGLTNEELHKCHYHIQIPSNPACSSLNISAAVQVITYELYMASLATQELTQDWDFPWSTQQQMEDFFQHLEKVLIDINFLNPEIPRQLMNRLRRFYMRAKLDSMEMNIFRGILGNIQKKLLTPSQE